MLAHGLNLARVPIKTWCVLGTPCGCLTGDDHAARTTTPGPSDDGRTHLLRGTDTDWLGPANEPSRRVIEKNGGVLDEQLGDELRFWIG